MLSKENVILLRQTRQTQSSCEHFQTTTHSAAHSCTVVIAIVTAQWGFERNIQEGNTVDCPVSLDTLTPPYFLAKHNNIEYLHANPCVLRSMGHYWTHASS